MLTSAESAGSPPNDQILIMLTVMRRRRQWICKGEGDYLLFRKGRVVGNNTSTVYTTAPHTPDTPQYYLVLPQIGPA